MTSDEKWVNAYDRALEIVGQMTIPEKVNLTTGTGWMSEACVGTTGGVPRLGVPQFCLQDGPLGVRFTDFGSAFSSAIGVGSTFNKDLMHLRGKAIALEHKNKGVDIVLGPAMGPLGRTAAGGRNWEGFGSDPYLQGAGAKMTIRAIQEAGLIATAKHFIGNEQEHFRQSVEDYGVNISTALSSNIDDRAMHELYLWPFADSVHEGVGSVMCSYQKVNNTYACENSYMMNNLLKGELGFQGFVMSDWWAMHSGPESAHAGTDMVMPGETLITELGASWWGRNLTQFAVDGQVNDWRLHDMAVRIMAAYYYVGLDKDTIGAPNFNSWSKATKGYLHFDEGEQGVINKHVNVMNNTVSKTASMQVAAEAIVLLKNEKCTLPLGTPHSINLFGIAAGPGVGGPNCEDNLGCSEGALGSGWGSGAVRFPYLTTPLEAISEIARQRSIMIDYSLTANASNPEIASKAPYSDVNIIFGLTDSGEGFLNVDGNIGDRSNTSLWHNADAVIEAVIKENSNNIVVISSVGAVNMEKWIDHENVTAVIFTAPTGQDIGTAIANALFGVAPISGKLPFTIARNDTDYIPVKRNVSAEENGAPQQDFTEGLYIDYRLFDKNNVTPRFEFGYGLSYSNFSISDAAITPKQSQIPLELPQGASLKPADAISCSLSSTSDPQSLLFPSGISKIKNYLYPYLTSLTGVPAQLNTTCMPFDSSNDTTSLAAGGLGGNPALWETVYTVTATATNHGPMLGSYAFQLYVQYPDTPEDAAYGSTPIRQLRGFEKPALDVGTSAPIAFDLLRRDISVWDTTKQSWIVPRGEYKVYIGYSSRDFAWTGSFTI